MILKICNIVCIGPFFRQQGNLTFNVGGKFSASVFRAENAAAGAFGAVPVGTGETAVNGQLNRFFTEIVF